MRGSERLRRVALGGLGAAIAALFGVVGVAGAAPAKAPIVVGETCDCSGATASTSAGFGPGLQIWAKAVNAKGGILGHKVVVDEIDTKSDPTAGLVATKQLLLQQNVVALVAGSSLTPVASVIAQAKAPVLGGIGGDPTENSSPWIFPVATTADQNLVALTKIGQNGQSSAKGAILYCAEDPSCAALVAPEQQLAPTLGSSIPFTAKISAGEASYTAECLAAQSSGASYAFVFDADAVFARLVAACSQNNYNPRWLYYTFDKFLGSDPDLNHGNVLVALGDTLYTGAPAATFRSQVAKYDPSVVSSASYGQYTYKSWLFGQLLQKALQKANPKGATITRADVFRGLYALKGETLAGQTPPLTFAAGKPHSIKCYFSATIKGGALNQIGGLHC